MSIARALYEEANSNFSGKKSGRFGSSQLPGRVEEKV